MWSVLPNGNENTLIAHSPLSLIHSCTHSICFWMAPLIRYLPHSPLGLVFSFLLFLSLSGLHWYFINFYSCISRIWSIQFSHKVSEVSAFSRFSLTLHSLPLSVPPLKRFAGCIPRWAMLEINYAATWFFAQSQMEMDASCGRHQSRSPSSSSSLQFPAVLSSSSSSMYRQLVCPLPQPMRPQLTQLFNWIEAINTQSETETKPEIEIALEGHVVS